MTSGGGAAVACPRCGATASGNFCSECGSPLTQGAACASCGGPLKAGALYCSACGQAAGARPRKARVAYVPWIVSGLALAAFSVVIALLVQGQSEPRVGDMLPTGNLPGQSGAGAGSAAGSPMPSMEELAAMSPRQAADRLFERAMREHEGGDFERAGFFVDMALQAYDAVPPAETDADARFHVGLLRLVQGDSVGARTSAEEILTPEPDHLLGLILAARAARFAGDQAAAAVILERARAIVEREGGIPERPEYESHRPLIEREVSGEGT